MKKQLLKNTCSSLALCAFLIGCGSGGGESSNSNAGSNNVVSTTSYLLDAAVAGVKYVNADGSTGFTNSNGSFTYKTGITSFYVGGVKIGEISSLASDSKTFIQDVVGVERTNISHPEVLKIATFLQSIDSDPSTPEIEIGDNAKKFDDITVDLTKKDSNVSVNDLLTDRNFTVRSESDVKNHLEVVLKSHNINVDKKAPSIVSSNLSSKINIDDNLIIKFSEKILLDTVSKDNFELLDENGSSVGVSLSYSSSSNSIILNPSSKLQYGKNYKLTIKKGVEDISSNKLLNEVVINFSTFFLPDEEKPNVSLLSDGTDIRLDANLVVKFSEGMNESTINSNSIKLKDSGNNTIASNLTYNSSTFEVTINPVNNLKASTSLDDKYTIKLSNTITDLSGLAIDTIGNETLDFAFTTLSVQNSQGAVISNTSNLSDIATNSNISLTFSKELLEDSLINNVTLKNNAKTFNHTIKYSMNGSILNINPVSDLKEGATYTLSISNKVKDIYGNFLDYAQTKTYKITIAKVIDNTKPKLVENEANITNNEKNVALNKVFTFIFDEALKLTTVNDTNITLKDINNNNITIIVSYSNMKVTITPSVPLSFSKSYVLELNSGITDLADNNFDGEPFGIESSKIINFQTLADVNDNTLPTLVTTPALGVITKDAKVKLEFSEELYEINSSNHQSFLIVPNGYFFESYSNKILTLRVGNNDFDTEYELILKSTIKDLNNNRLNSDITVTFKTAVEPDTSSPEILSSIPSDNVDNVNVNTNLNIVFDEELEASSVNNTNILLVKKDNVATNVLTSGDILYDNANKKIVINPSNDLELNTDYILIIKKDGIKDLFNNAFSGSYGSDYKVEFKTRESASTVTCTSSFKEYNNACYKIENTVKKFADAKTSCETQSAKLINPKTLFYSGGWSSSLVEKFASNIGLDINKIYWTNSDSDNQSFVIKKSFFSGWGEPNSFEDTNNAHEYICVK